MEMEVENKFVLETDNSLSENQNDLNHPNDGNIDFKSTEPIQSQKQQSLNWHLPLNFALNNKFNKNEQIKQVIKTEQKLFDDDQVLEVNVTKGWAIQSQYKENYDLLKGVQLELRPLKKVVQLSQTQETSVLSMISLKTQENTESVEKAHLIDGMTIQGEQLNQNRPGIDLICVIDKSGSMYGEQMELTQNCLKLLKGFLKEQDRLCLVNFNSKGKRMTELMRVNDKNSEKFSSQIDSLEAGGGTDIDEGLKLAVKTLRDRKQVNSVSSIFLMTDGLDQDAQKKVALTLEEANIKDNFTIHTFGFGEDHDPKLMDNISKMKDGNFYYIEKLDQIDQSFVDALGGLFSIIGQDVAISLKVERKYPFTDHMISKTFGRKFNSNKLTGEYSIFISQLMSGISKEFIFQLSVPPCQNLLQDDQRNINLISATVEIQRVGDDALPPIIMKSQLNLTIFNEGEEVAPEIDVYDSQVLYHFLRVQGAEVLEEAIRYADQRQYEQGKRQIDEFLLELKNSPTDVQIKLQDLENDLNRAKGSCDQINFQQFGLKLMTSCMRSHMEQKSNGSESCNYANIQQKSLQSQVIRIKSMEY